MPFVKLDCGILDSTLWFDRNAREIFLTALLMAGPIQFDGPSEEIAPRTLDKTGWTAPPGEYGFVPASSFGIIRRAGLEQEDGLTALERLASPEENSRTPDFNGRRLIRIDGGYLVLNYMKYRDRDYTTAARSRRYRRRHAVSSVSHTVSSRDITQAEAEAYTEADKEKRERVRFAPPTLEEVHEYAKELPGLRVEAFFDFYASKGWKVGVSPMKDWRAAARRWRRKDTEDGKITPPKPAKELTQEQRRYDEVMKDFAGDLKAWEAVHGPSKLLR